MACNRRISTYCSCLCGIAIVLLLDCVQIVSSGAEEQTQQKLDELQLAISERDADNAEGIQRLEHFTYPSFEISWPKGLSEARLNGFQNEVFVKALVSLSGNRFSHWRRGEIGMTMEQRIDPNDVAACDSMGDSKLNRRKQRVKKDRRQGVGHKGAEPAHQLSEIKIAKMCPLIFSEAVQGDADALAKFSVDLLMPLMQAYKLLQEDPEIVIVTDLGEGKEENAQPTILRQLWTRIGFGPDRVVQYEENRTYAVGELIAACRAPLHPALLAAFRTRIGLADDANSQENEKTVFLLPGEADNVSKLIVGLIHQLRQKFGDNLVLVGDSLSSLSEDIIGSGVIGTSDAVMGGILRQARSIIGFSEQKIYAYSLFSLPSTTIVELCAPSEEYYLSKKFEKKSKSSRHSKIPFNWLFTSMVGQNYWQIECSLDGSDQRTVDWQQVVDALESRPISSIQSEKRVESKKFTVVVAASLGRMEHITKKIIPAVLSAPRDLVDLKLISSNPKTCEAAPSNVTCVVAPEYIPEGDPPINGDTMERYHWYSQETADLAFALAQAPEDSIAIFLEDDVIATSNWLDKFMKVLAKVPDSWAMFDLYTPGMAKFRNGELYHFYCCTQALALNRGYGKKVSDYLYQRAGEEPPDWIIRDYQDEKGSEFEIRATNPSLFQHAGIPSTLGEKVRLKSPSHVSASFRP